jgi:hypothetical protein
MTTPAAVAALPIMNPLTLASSKITTRPEPYPSRRRHSPSVAATTGSRPLPRGSVALLAPGTLYSSRGGVPRLLHSVSSRTKLASANETEISRTAAWEGEYDHPGSRAYHPLRFLVSAHRASCWHCKAVVYAPSISSPIGARHLGSGRPRAGLTADSPWVMPCPGSLGPGLGRRRTRRTVASTTTEPRDARKWCVSHSLFAGADGLLTTALRSLFCDLHGLRVTD